LSGTAVSLVGGDPRVPMCHNEKDDLRKMMGWLSGHEPQLRMMFEANKRYVCDKTAQNNSVLSPKHVHVTIKQ
jgi:hypothetical protein